MHRTSAIPSGSREAGAGARADARIAVVQVADPRMAWSVPAAAVIRIVPAAGWAAPVVDVLAAFGAPRDGATRRIVILRDAAGRDAAVLAAGAIEIAEVGAADVLALPDVFAAIPHVAAIVVAADRSLSLLLQPSCVRPSEDTVVGEDLCPSRS